jgi:osmotically-inducible protein OsmY
MHSLPRNTLLASLFLMMAMLLPGCSNKDKSPDVAGPVRQSLDQSGLKDVTVSQDRTLGVVTLGGKVTNDADKARAEAIAQGFAPHQVVANQIAVIPPGASSDVKTVMSDLDKGIDKNLDAALIQNGYKDGVKYDIKNGVVTLTGEVSSQAKRSQVAAVASGVPNVTQVVNELQIKGQKANSR